MIIMREGSNYIDVDVDTTTSPYYYLKHLSGLHLSHGQYKTIPFIDRLLPSTPISTNNNNNNDRNKNRNKDINNT